jgi:hypothetical protein
MTDDTDRVGLGKVVYSTEECGDEETPEEQRAKRADVAEADHESFPASDPPGYAGTSAIFDEPASEQDASSEAPAPE